MFLKELILQDPDYLPSYKLFERLSQKLTGKTFHCHVHILYLLRKFLGPSPKTYVEIGSFFGASLSFLANHPYPTNIYGVDHSFFKDNRTKAIKKNIKRFGKSWNKVNLIPGDSTALTTLSQVKFCTPNGIDLLFVDGDRSKEGVLNDLENYLPLVNPEGFIAVDDYHDHISCPGVKEAIDALMPTLKEDFDFVTDLPNIANAGLSKTYDYKEKKYPQFLYNNLLILKRKSS